MDKVSCFPIQTTPNDRRSSFPFWRRESIVHKGHKSHLKNTTSYNATCALVSTDTDGSQLIALWLISANDVPCIGLEICHTNNNLSLVLNGHV